MLFRSTFTPRRDRLRGFTLVELLVVIGIIALLIGVLLPALSRAREQSNKVACQSNMRQLATGFMMYVAENGGYFPRPATTTVQNEDWIYWYNLPTQPAPLNDPNNSPMIPFLGGTFVAKVYRCPSDDPTLHTGGTFPYSYTVNEAICRAPQGVGVSGSPGYHSGTVPMLKITQIVESSSKALIIDESGSTVDDGCWAPQNYVAAAVPPKNLLSNRHDQHGEQPSSIKPAAGRGNVAFADGHVDFIDRTLCMDPKTWDAPWDGTGTPP